MVRQEETGKRDLAYHLWHRILPNFCYMVDIDVVEWRAGRGIVAFIEVARQTALVHKKRFQLGIVRDIALKCGAKAFLVLYNENLTMFEVYDLLSNEDWAKCNKTYMNEEEHEKFIKNL